MRHGGFCQGAQDHVLLLWLAWLWNTREDRLRLLLRVVKDGDEPSGQATSSLWSDHLLGHQTLIKNKGAWGRWGIWATYLQNEEEANHEFLLSHCGRHLFTCQTCQLIIHEGRREWGVAWGGLTREWGKEISVQCNFCSSWPQNSLHTELAGPPFVLNEEYSQDFTHTLYHLVQCAIVG